jgi:hypothetical protein
VQIEKEIFNIVIKINSLREWRVCCRKSLKVDVYLICLPLIWL